MNGGETGEFGRFSERRLFLDSVSISGGDEGESGWNTVTRPFADMDQPQTSGVGSRNVILSMRHTVGSVDLLYKELQRLCPARFDEVEMRRFLAFATLQRQSRQVDDKRRFKSGELPTGCG